MKTERRHELQTNALAHRLAVWIEAAKPYSKAGLAVLVAIVVGLFSWGFISAQNNRRASDGWNQLYKAMSGTKPDPRDDLADLSEQYAGTNVGEAARLMMADFELTNGTNRLMGDRSIATKELKHATEIYQAVLLETHDSILRERAIFGLARAYEALGQLEKAREQYRALLSEFPEGPFAAAAKSRAADLELAATKGFYDWLAKYEPPSAAPSGPGRPGARPDFLKEPSSEGGLKLPSVTEESSSAPATGDAPAADAPASDAPAAAPESATPPAAETPAAESPAEPK